MEQFRIRLSSMKTFSVVVDMPFFTFGLCAGFPRSIGMVYEHSVIYESIMYKYLYEIEDSDFNLYEVHVKI